MFFVALVLTSYLKVKESFNMSLLEKVGKVTKKQVEEIAKTKMPDLNTVDLVSAMSQVEGTAKSMGLEVTG